MIEQINEILERIGSNFRTEDGLTICMYLGHLVFLRKTFDSQTECLEYAQSAAERIASR